MRVCEIAVIIAVILLSFILAICDVYNASITHHLSKMLRYVQLCFVIYTKNANY